MMSSSPQTLLALIETVRRLRAPDGCPWDRAQTHQSLRPYLIEEAYEVLDVLDRIEGPAQLRDEKISGAFREELGDLLMQVLLHAQMASEEGAFDFIEVAGALNEKLIRRHPHVFGEGGAAPQRADGVDSALSTWEKQKAREKAAGTAEGKPAGLLAGLPRALPALQRAHRMIEKVSRVGFHWKSLSGTEDARGAIQKLEEEIAEFKAEATRAKPDPVRVEEELGDALFSLCNCASMLGIEPEIALRRMLERFQSRFSHIETRLHEQGKSPEQSTLEEMDALWNEAKKAVPRG